MYTSAVEVGLEIRRVLSSNETEYNAWLRIHFAKKKNKTTYRCINLLLSQNPFIETTFYSPFAVSA